MTTRETTSLFIKWIALYSLVSFVSSGLQTMAYSFFSWSSEAQMGLQRDITFTMLGYTVLGIAFAVLLIRFSDLIAKLIFKTDSPAFKLDRLETGDVQTLGCHFIGLTQVAVAIPKLVQVLVSIRARQAPPPGECAPQAAGRPRAAQRHRCQRRHSLASKRSLDKASLERPWRILRTSPKSWSTRSSIKSDEASRAILRNGL